MQKKGISSFSAITFLILVGGFIAGLILTKTNRELRSKATNTGPTLAILPASISLAVGQTTTMGISINTNNDTVAAAELHLTYDPASVQVISFTPQVTLPVVLKPAAISNGNIHVTLGVNPEHPLRGSAIIGSIHIKLLTNTQSAITVANDTIVASLWKETNTLAGSTGAQVLSGGATPALTPTLSPTPTPVPIAGDMNGDGEVTIIDYTLYMSYWLLNNIEKADLNGDGNKSVIDYTIFMNAWNNSH